MLNKVKLLKRWMFSKLRRFGQWCYRLRWTAWTFSFLLIAWALYWNVNLDTIDRIIFIVSTIIFHTGLVYITEHH